MVGNNLRKDRVYRRVKDTLPDPDDTTLVGLYTVITPGFVRYVGELLFGERWQTPLARTLGEIRGKQLLPSVIHRWLSGERPLPDDWLKEALAIALEQGARDLARRARDATDVASRIRHPLTMEEALQWEFNQPDNEG